MKYRVKGTVRETYPLRSIALLPDGRPKVLAEYPYTARAKVELECGHIKMVPWPVTATNLRRRCQACSASDDNETDVTGAE